MNQSFTYQKLTIEVRAENGLDLIDRPMLNRIVADYVGGEVNTDIDSLPPLVWNRITVYTRFLQLSTVTGKGLVFPTLESDKATIGAGYEAWVTFVAEHVECYRQWDSLIDEVNKDTLPTDPQAKSAEGKPESE